MKKVAIILERADMALGGAERSAFELAQALSQAGLEVDILAAKGLANAENVHILCQNQPGKRICYFTFAKALQKYLAQNDYEVIHSVLPFGFADVYQPRGGAYAEAALRNAASYQNKVLESFKNITSFANVRRTILLQAEKKLCKNPAGPIVAALSKYVAEQFRKHYGLADERIVVTPNGVKTDALIDAVEADKLRARILAEFSLEEKADSKFFLFVANNFRLKGLNCLIRALQIASGRDKTNNCFLIVAGNDKPRQYRKLAKELGVLNRIIFLGHLSQIQEALSIADVAVLPTFYDPSSRFILEAIAAGKPVITTAFNGAVDLFANDRHGKVIGSPQDINALAEALSYFSNTDNIQTAGEAIAADNLKEKISIGRVAEQLECLYKSISDNRR